MKTRILYRRGSGDFVFRAFLPDEEDATKDYAKARFEPEHTFDFHRMGDPKTHKGRAADTIRLGSYGFTAHWSKPLEHAVILSDEDLAELERHDEAVSAALRARRDFMIEAASRSRGLRIDDIVKDEENVAE